MVMTQSRTRVAAGFGSDPENIRSRSLYLSKQSAKYTKPLPHISQHTARVRVRAKMEDTKPVEISSSKMFGGYNKRFKHFSPTLGCSMNFHIYFPPSPSSSSSHKFPVSSSLSFISWFHYSLFNLLIIPIPNSQFNSFVFISGALLALRSHLHWREFHFQIGCSTCCFQRRCCLGYPWYLSE